jgi:hypothetical protein
LCSNLVHRASYTYIVHRAPYIVHRAPYTLVVETCGGLAPDAVRLLDLTSGAASEHLSLWSQRDAVRHVLDTVAIAIQKGNAMTVLDAHARQRCVRRERVGDQG